MLSTRGVRCLGSPFYGHLFLKGKIGGRSFWDNDLASEVTDGK